MLIPEAELEDELRPELTRLLELKKTLPEMGMAPKIQIMNDYIERVMAWNGTMGWERNDGALDRLVLWCYNHYL